MLDLKSKFDKSKIDISVYGSEEKQARIVRFFTDFVQTWLAPLVRLFSRFGMTANMFSMFSLVVSIFFPIVIIFSPGWAAFLLALHIFFDSFDGALARYMGQNNNKGAMIDLFSDLVAICTTMVGFELFDLIPGWLALLYVFLYSANIMMIMLRQGLRSRMRWNVRPRWAVYTAFFVAVIFHLDAMVQVVFLSTLLLLGNVFVHYRAMWKINANEYFE